MAIIINEFEVVAEPPPGAQAGQGRAASGAENAPASPAPAPSGPKPIDLRRVEEHQLLRRLRLWAH